MYMVVKLENVYNSTGLVLEDKSNLINVEITNSLIENIPSAFWDAIKNVRQLSLRRNNLTKIPNMIRNFTKLQKLTLKGNSISEISHQDVLFISKIKVVDLAKNQIEFWPNYIDASEVTATSFILKLDLSYNNLKHLFANSFWQLPSLAFLNLSNNKLSSFDKDLFKGLSMVTTIDLKSNNITIIYALSFRTNFVLEKLYLQHNDISIVQDGAFFNSKEMKHLNLSYNHLTTLANTWTFGLRYLDVLDISYNQISWIRPNFFHQSSHLKYLNISHNHLQRVLPNVFSSLSDLKVLSLSHNQIEHLNKQSLNGMHSLTDLDLSSNGLAVCLQDGLVLADLSMPSLHFLNFSANRLLVLPPYTFKYFPNLNGLDLTANPVVTIHPNAFYNLNLTRLYFESQSLNCDCRLRWFSKWLQESTFEESRILAQCSRPSNFINMDMQGLDFDNITCAEKDPYIQLVLQLPKEMNAIEGKENSIVCSGYGASPINVQWKIYEKEQTYILDNFNNDKDIEITVNNTLITNGSSFESVSSVLRFKKVTSANEAQYQCIMSNPYGPVYSGRSMVSVVSIPIFVERPQSVLVSEGETIRLKCKADGIPPPIIKWSKGNDNFFPAAFERRLHIDDDENSDDFYILKAKVKDTGEYTCNAENAASTSKEKVLVVVVEQPSSNSLNETTIEIEETDTLNINCVDSQLDSFDWQEYLEIEWIKNNNLTMDQVESTAHFCINDTLIEDRGKYTCIIRSKNGDKQYEKSFYVDIHERSNFRSAIKREIKANGSYIAIFIGIFIAFIVSAIVLGKKLLQKPNQTNIPEIGVEEEMTNMLNK
uniref:Ig-like domain-containing protein n=1 Tax=Rhabditophanes sp. KR3021 TaxID=114890 RepID=A0AC35U8Y1_9BILA